MWAEWGERKLLPELESGLDVVTKGDQKRRVEVSEMKDESVRASEKEEKGEKVHPAAVIGPTLPPPSYRPPTDERQHTPVQEADRQNELEDEDESGAGYGPRLATQLTADETAALEQLQQARQHVHDTKQHIQHLRSAASTSSTAAPLAHEEWMTVVPDAMSGQAALMASMTGDNMKGLRSAASTSSTAAPLAHEEWMTVVPDAMSGQAALMASMTGDRAMKGRAFAMRSGGDRGERDSSGWAAGPEEREWRRMEREAEKAVEKALAHLRAVHHRVHNKPAASASDTTPAHTSTASAPASSAKPSLLELHQQRLKDAQSSVVHERGAPIFWDREKEMGMRRHKTFILTDFTLFYADNTDKTDQQIRGEMRGATELSSRFAMAGT